MDLSIYACLHLHDSSIIDGSRRSLTLLTLLFSFRSSSSSSSSRLLLLTLPHDLFIPIPTLHRHIRSPQSPIRMSQIPTRIDDIPHQTFQHFDFYRNSQLPISHLPNPISTHTIELQKKERYIPGNPPFVFLSQRIVPVISTSSPPVPVPVPTSSPCVPVEEVEVEEE